ncbi:hypothetical protein SAMN05444167_1771 [Terriglobus roseus]|uniref:Uncharacterized protein n=2 Tax=Terriglobus roseus TaxID=392734 RepID=A0A1G7JCH4_9BACT|nr:hypothetical protein SAMN05444167_1771 [Terriglobus roseus]
MLPYLFCLLLAASYACDAQLLVTYGSKGVDRLTYNGTVLADASRFQQDQIHVGHMKLTDGSGRVLTADGWGETNQGTKWDAASKTEIYNFRWGTIKIQFSQKSDALEINISESNRPNSGVIFDGASVYPLTLHFPTLPRGFVNANYPQGTSNTSAPSVTVADFGTGQVVDVAPDASKPLYSMLWPTGTGDAAYSVLVSTTTPDGLPEFYPRHDRPVLPGQTDSFRIALRFAPHGVAASTLASDAYSNWSRQYPAEIKWTDRRVIGTAYLASSPKVDQPADAMDGANPRHYLGSGMDLRTPEGQRLFQSRILAKAGEIVRNLRKLNAQGVITWDIEGQQYPQNTSYVCAPDQIAKAAPEMESVVMDTTPPYVGKKLDDAYFSIIRDAGFRVGVCVRPQRFTLLPGGGAQQVQLSEKDAEADMLRKIRYAHDRWGATLFYLDSTVEQNGRPLDAGMFQRLAAAFPDSLLIPEQSTPRHYAYTAPLKSFLFHNETATNADIRTYYPDAFSCILVNDSDAKRLLQSRAALVAAVAAGDILMAHADYWDPANTRIVAMYGSAGRSPGGQDHDAKRLRGSVENSVGGSGSPVPLVEPALQAVKSSHHNVATSE